MGKKGGWLHAVRKALSSQQKEKKDQQKSKSKKELSSENISFDAVVSPEEVNSCSIPSPPPVADEPKRTEIDMGNEQNKHAYSVALATAKAAEAAAAAAQAAAEVVRLTSMPRFVGKSKEEIAAIKIQTAFRGYMARKALRALRDLVRLKSLLEGQSAKRQAANTLRCMQTLARVHSQIHTRRIRMAEENQALQRQLQLKQERENETLRMGETWDDTTRSKEQIEAKLQNKQEAAMRRERALAYAYTHQSRKNSKNSNPMFMDPNNPQWGWSWLERWMAARPWETRSISEKELNDQGSVKSFKALSVAGEINRANALQDHSFDGNNKASTSARRVSRAPTYLGRPRSSTPGPRKVKPGSPEGGNGLGSPQVRQRRHSIGGLLVRDDESIGCSPAMKSKKKPGNVDQQRQQPVGLAKKRLSYPASPGGPRRHSVGGKMEISPVRETPIEKD